jgi:hypothetical protein
MKLSVSFMFSRCSSANFSGYMFSTASNRRRDQRVGESDERVVSSDYLVNIARVSFGGVASAVSETVLDSCRRYRWKR